MVRYFLYSYNRSLHGRKREIINEKGRGGKGVQNKARKKKRKKRYPLANAIQNPDMQINQRKINGKKKKEGVEEQKAGGGSFASKPNDCDGKTRSRSAIHTRRKADRKDSKEVEKRNRQLSPPRSKVKTEQP